MDDLEVRRERLVRTAWAAVDVLVIVVAAYTSALLRYDLDVARVIREPIAVFAVVAAVVFLAAGVLIGPYRVGHQRGSFDEAADLARAVGAMTFGLAVPVVLGWSTGAPRSLPLSVGVFALVGMFAVRFIVRSYRWGRTAAAGSAQKVVVYGAGSGGHQLLRALGRDDQTPYVPVALLDDDPRKRRLRIDGLPVVGGLDRLGAVARRSGASTLIVAMPSADAELVRRARDRAEAAGLDVLVLPPITQLFGSPDASDLRRLNLEDVLGRRRISLDDNAIAHSIRDRVVLVTGAGGSIGSELARQIDRYGPRKLILLDRDESALHAVQMSLTGRALLDDGTLALVDIRDLDAVRRTFAREQPEIVFHAAALKHLTLLEQFPLEGWKTNVRGTLNVLQAAEEVGVETFVNVSTDKAANPSCVLGYTKRLAERLTAEYADRSAHGRFVSVRFGNVLGSRGSVVEAFTAQVERGGPVTVTHPDVERYFMLISEASQLVLQAATMGDGGEVMVLDMGEPVKIVDLARTLINLSGRRDIDIAFTGLRPGEKLSEELFHPHEAIQRSSHPLVSHVGVPAISPDEVQGVDLRDRDATRAWMREHAAVTATRSVTAIGEPA